MSNDIIRNAFSLHSHRTSDLRIAKKADSFDERPALYYPLDLARSIKLGSVANFLVAPKTQEIIPARAIGNVHGRQHPEFCIQNQLTELQIGILFVAIENQILRKKVATKTQYAVLLYGDI